MELDLYPVKLHDKVFKNSFLLYDEPKESERVYQEKSLKMNKVKSTTIKTVAQLDAEAAAEVAADQGIPFVRRARAQTSNNYPGIA